MSSPRASGSSRASRRRVLAVRGHPDELQASGAWRDGRLHGRVRSIYNEQLIGDCEAGEMHFSFFDLVAHIARTRRFAAGTILGSGTVSNAERSRGVSCLAERRMIEIIDSGAARTPFMAVGDRIRIEASIAGTSPGASPFGAIDQRVVAAGTVVSGAQPTPGAQP
jgi:fumarylacetoacetate (FAA) hydrolase